MTAQRAIRGAATALPHASDAPGAAFGALAAGRYAVFHLGRECGEER